ncbi:hypothetical protein [Chryseobacterium sp. W4I1]|nr:hypothetical protein [Chryseobacterium sp. W4I1]MDQ0781182.1 hypothetical protein [Chryseobacterium sp. W4I1]
MKTMIVLACCLISLTACRCDITEDDDKKKNDSRIKSDTLKIG